MNSEKGPLEEKQNKGGGRLLIQGGDYIYIYIYIYISQEETRRQKGDTMCITVFDVYSLF